MKVFVTGASKGLGYAIASSLTSENISVVGCARSNGVFPFEYIGGVDLSNLNTLSFIDEKLKDCDCLINNAAVAYDGLLATQSEESILKIINTNLSSALILNKRYIRERLKNKLSGNIINISSIISIRGYAGLAAYAASKAGLDGMTRSLARELGPKGFRVNSILPGYMETDMSKSLSKEQKEKIIKRTPLGRLAKIEDIVPVVKFLISENSKFLTGQSIVVDGGITV